MTKHWREFKEDDVVVIHNSYKTRSDAKSSFTKDKYYLVGGKYHGKHDTFVGVQSDDLGEQNGLKPEFLVKIDTLSFEAWWNRYYPQEYGHNAEFRDIVERHAKRAFEAGKNSK